ncbi:MAG: RNA pseudouridine synthase [Nitrosomonadaceae bacterium]|nr:RNA pseudouridine synthase [Nitrosomonadaceae bacterium]|tara:strand:+ start:3515 stop:4513 length:999 start_codon:yes stop_codon:yes gene_type:complete
MDLGKEFPRSKVINEIIGENSHNQRIDNFLIKRLKGVPRSHIYMCLRKGQVRINGKRIKASCQLQKGDMVRIPPIAKRNTSSTNKISNSRLISFDILFQDESLLVINKPTGVAVHGGSNISFGVIEQLRAQYPNWKFLELVHRLDRETSGSLLLAKKRATLIELHRQIREREMKKHYLVLVKGKWQNHRQNVKFPLNKYFTASGERRVAVAIDKKNYSQNMTAHTVFTLKKTWEDFSLLEAELITGRTHQIRVHLAHLGFPVIGDNKYGDFQLNKKLSKTSGKGPKLKRMFLHASLAIVTHPTTGKILHLAAPLTNDLQKFLNDLDTKAKKI